MNVLPEYLEGNRTGSYTPEQWLDEVKDKNSDEIIQEGTPMDAEHFNHMEQGIHNNSLMLALLLENVKHTQQSVESVDGEELEVTLTNTKDSILIILLRLWHLQICVAHWITGLSQKYKAIL